MGKAQDLSGLTLIIVSVIEEFWKLNSFLFANTKQKRLNEIQWCFGDRIVL
jgi:hypothetical protein